MRPLWNEIQSCVEETHILWSQFDSLLVENHVLFRKFHHSDGSTSHKQIVIPSELRQSFLESLHMDPGNASSHLGIRKTQEHVKL